MTADTKTVTKIKIIIFTVIHYSLKQFTGCKRFSHQQISCKRWHRSRWKRTQL